MVHFDPAAVVTTTGPFWTDVVSAVGAILTPFAVAIVAYYFARRTSRGDVRVAARMDYYRALAPDLNTLMCYMTFIGTWKELTPPDVLALKRRLDTAFFSAAPLFSEAVAAAYNAFMNDCFGYLHEWTSEAHIRSSALDRRSELPVWHESWDDMFVLGDGDAVSRESLQNIRASYDQLLASLVRDIDVTPPRPNYTTPAVVLHSRAREAAEMLDEGSEA